jgi:glucose dehydrogenase
MRATGRFRAATIPTSATPPLDQINAGKVASLVPVTIIQTGMTATFETTPIVVDGVMYATAPFVDDKMKIMALNAATPHRRARLRSGREE